MFSLGHSEEVCLQRKESPLQLLSGLPAGNHGFPHRCPSGGGGLKSQTSPFKAHYLTSQCSVLERKAITSNGHPYLPIQTCSQDYKRSITMATHIYPCRTAARIIREASPWPLKSFREEAGVVSTCSKRVS